MMERLLSAPGLAALGWLSTFGILWALLLGLAEPGWNVAGMWLFSFVTAVGAAAKRK